MQTSLQVQYELLEIKSESKLMGIFLANKFTSPVNHNRKLEWREGDIYYERLRVDIDSYSSKINFTSLLSAQAI